MATARPDDTFYGPAGRLARVLPGYEERAAQQRLSAAVAGVLEGGGLLLAEAGTGTGKTLAYLLPAVELGRRVVVSTGTKNLQEQLVQKDIPILAKALGRDLSVAVMKGRGNYLCLLRLSSFGKAGTFRRTDDIPLFRAVEAWAPQTQTGDRAEVPDLPDNVDFWREISAASENCIGQSCPLFDACWVTQMRQRALEADLVVVNHHLLCADLAVKDDSYGQVIPPYDTVILDEAHLLEDVATQYFGVQVSSYRVEELARDAERELKAAELDAREVRAEIEGVRTRSERFFRRLAGAAPARLPAGWVMERATEEALALLQRLEGLRTALLAIPDRPEPIAGLAGRALALAAELAFLFKAEDDSHVYFVETRGRGVFLRATPIDVSGRLKELLFERVRAAVLTSATLAVDGGFTYVKDRLGIEATDELLLPSPFHYEEQAVLYVPRHLPEPPAPGFVDAAAEEILGLLELSRGRAFVLFTSYANMNAVAERIAGRIRYPVFIQGEAPKPVLLDTFRETPHAVLLATASFWQGVDVAGEQLSCVIVDKLPFASPGDPVVAARIERLRSRGGNPFAEYQVPVAVLMLKQGLGRLIRTSSDTGILAVLDSRLLRKSYGQRFLESLPPARLVHELAEVERFLA
jgi:ATP-dependent DNA helicase DinG